MDLSRRLQRYRRFYDRQQPGGLLVIAHFPSPDGAPAIDLRDFDFDRIEEHRRYWDLLAERTRAGIAHHEGVDDDWIPGIVLHYGFGAFGAVYCDVPLVFTDNTSYMARALDGWDDWARLSYDPGRFWSRVFTESAAYLSAQAQGDFLVDPYPNPSPLDVANLGMGDALFTALYDEPERMAALLDRLTGEIVRNYRAVQASLRSPHGGTLTFNAWIPRGILLLEDAADLCSPATYRRFGQPYTSRVVAACGGGYIHHHSLGRQQYGNMASIPGLTVLQISSDPNCRRPPEDLAHVLNQAGGMAVDLECTALEIRDHIDEFRAGRCILRADCSSREEAADLVAFVRAHSSIPAEP
jgi:hypothetical protein